MNKLVRYLCVLLLGFPIAAMADPVVVTTHSVGTTTVDDTIMTRALGLASVPAGVFVPYELTLTSTFESATNSAPTAVSYGGQVIVDFRIGTQLYHYEGVGSSSAYREAQSGSLGSYDHHVTFDTAGPPNTNFTIHFYNTLYGLPGSTGMAGPLAPLDADEGDGAYGGYTIHAFPSYPDVPLSWHMGAPATSLSVHVAAVPEPASFALLAAGLLTLFLRRLRGRVVRRAR